MGRLPRLLALVGLLALPAAADAPTGDRRSGFDSMSPETQAMQRDDAANPGMLWVGDGEALWEEKAGASGRSCAGCHGDAKTSMRGVSARHPAFDPATQRPIDLRQRIDACRRTRQEAPPLPPESPASLALDAFVAHQSRGLPIAPPIDERLTPFREAGRRLFEQRQGQLDLSCANCHEDNAGRRLGGSLIPQAHPTGYPLYRLEWQGLGSLQRRLRNCMTGVRAEPYPYGSPEFVDLELFLMQRARGLPVETPAVRP